jgi:hypothetical protein
VLLAVLTMIGFWAINNGQPQVELQPTTAGSKPAATATAPTLIRVPTDCRTIAEALRRAGPDSTIRVEDQGTYTEELLIKEPTRLRGLTLEATQGATLAAPKGAYAGITIQGTPGVTVRGFKVQSGGDQHALMILRKAEGVTIENMHFVHAPDSTWVALYLAERAAGSAERPISIRNCSIEAGSMGLMIGGMNQGDAAHVVIENNRFLQASTHLFLKLPAANVRIQGNCFVGGSGIHMQPVAADGETQSVQVVNNTFFQTPVWLRAGRTTSPDSTVANNLIIESDRLGVPNETTLDEVVRAWSCRGNWWEPSAEAVAPEVGLVAQHQGRVELLSRDPSSHLFLRPPPNSPLLKQGIGGTYPQHISAYRAPSE